MGTRFTRVTVVGDARQIDISLPADAPLTEQMPTVLRLLSVPNTAVPVRWRLAAPEFGPIDPQRTLDEVGVLDGAALYLTEAAAAPPPPFVDDVESAVADFVVEVAPSWRDTTRRSSVARLLAIVLAAGLLLGLGAQSAVGWIAPLVVLMAGLGIGATIRDRGGLLPALAAVVAGPALLLGVVAAYPRLIGPDAYGDGHFGFPAGIHSSYRPIEELSNALNWNGFPLLLIAATALGLALAGAARRTPGLIVGGLAGLVVALGALIATRSGLPVDRTAGLALLVAVILTGLAGQAALGSAGLVDLMVADERGNPVPRGLVQGAVRRGLSVAGGLLWVAVAIGAVACWVLVVRSPDPNRTMTWVAPALGALGGAIFALRSRMFTRAAHVGPMLAVAVTTSAAVALRLPAWLSAGPLSASVLTAVVLLGVGALIQFSGLRTLREVTAARLQRAFERLELLAVLALVPGLVLLFRVIPAVQRWWG